MSAKVKVGLDIGFSSIKMVVVSQQRPSPKLLSVGMIACPQPGIVSDAQLDLDAVSTAIKSLVEEVKPPTKDVVIALPESRIFTRVVYDLPFLSDQELAQAIKFAAEEFVPMPINEVNLNYQIIFRSPQKGPNSRTVVFVVASPKALINKYITVLQGAGLKPSAIETEVVAVSRALVTNNQYSPTTLVIQLGALTTDYAIVSEGLILLTRSIYTGGMALTRAIAQSFNFEAIQAEEYKKVYGLQKDQLEGKLFQILKPIIDVIMMEGKRVIQAHEVQNPQIPVKRIVLTGGGAKLPGIVQYFAISLGLEVQEADPWFGITVDPRLKSKIADEGPLYSVALGLALREE